MLCGLHLIDSSKLFLNHVNSNTITYLIERLGIFNDDSDKKHFFYIEVFNIWHENADGHNIVILHFFFSIKHNSISFKHIYDVTCQNQAFVGEKGC